MKFDVNSFIMNAFVILFFTMVIGNLFGKIKFGKFSFGIAGALFLGLAVGFFLTKYAAGIEQTSPYYDRAVEITSGNIVGSPINTLSLLVFIVATGLLASKDMEYALKNFGKQFLILAIVIPLAGASVAYTAAKILPTVSPYQATGTYTGSLTSSAGLAAAIESADTEASNLANNFAQEDQATKEKILNILNSAKERDAKLSGEDKPEVMTLANTEKLDKEEIDLFASEAKAGVGIGHSIGYPFGVLGVVLAVNFLPNIFGIDVEEEKRKYFEQKARDEANQEDQDDGIEEVAMDYAGFSFAALLGYFLGHIEIYLGPLGYFKIGSTGGAIIVSLILGSIGKIGPMTFRMSSKVLGNMRTYFLAIFLSATGLNYGYRAVDAVTGGGLAIAIISMVVAILAIMVGFLIGHFVFKINWTLLSGAITGGMTSAPGLGAAIEAVGCDEPATSYGATQPIATLFMVIFSLIIHKLPI